MAKQNTSKPINSSRKADSDPKTLAPPKKRVFGTAKGQVIFKKGWDAPMTKCELDEFISG